MRRHPSHTPTSPLRHPRSSRGSLPRRLRTQPHTRSLRGRFAGLGVRRPGATSLRPPSLLRRHAQNPPDFATPPTRRDPRGNRRRGRSLRLPLQSATTLYLGKRGNYPSGETPRGSLRSDACRGRNHRLRRGVSRGNLSGPLFPRGDGESVGATGIAGMVAPRGSVDIGRWGNARWKLFGGRSFIVMVGRFIGHMHWRH